MSGPSLDRGTAVRIETQIRDWSETLVDPDTITCQIISPTGSTYMTATAMTTSSTGVFLIDKQTQENDPTGLYTIVIRATSASLTSLLREDGFTLE
jgi:uncharacterized protein YfaS (alpha-2-macroglobulin family)